jgi:hypothetical protein
MPVVQDLEELFRELERKKKEGPEVARLMGDILRTAGVLLTQAGSREGASPVSFARWLGGSAISTAAISSVRRALLASKEVWGGGMSSAKQPHDISGAPWCAPAGTRKPVSLHAPMLLVVSRAELLHALLEGALTDLDLVAGRAIFYPEIPRVALEFTNVNVRGDDDSHEHLALACSWTADLFREAELQGRAKLTSRYSECGRPPWLSGQRHWEELDWLLQDNGLKPTGKTGDLHPFEILRWFEENPREGLCVL